MTLKIEQQKLLNLKNIKILSGKGTKPQKPKTVVKV